MTRKIIALIGIALTIGSGMALAQQDRFTLQVPNGLAFSEIRGYETWQDVAVSQVQNGLKVIVANDTMINAYREGVPGNGKPFPDGSKIVKIQWSQKNPEFPYFVMVPDALQSVSFIVKDSKRFPDTHGWAYAQFAYDEASDTFKPSPLSLSGAECGYACHTVVAAKDYIFDRKLVAPARDIGADQIPPPSGRMRSSDRFRTAARRRGQR